MLDQLQDYRARLITRLAVQPAQFSALAASLSELEWRGRRLPDGATLHQLAAHIRDAEGLAFWPRFQRILAEDHPHLDPFPYHRWSVQAPRYQPDEPITAIAEGFARTRAEMMTVMDSLTPEQWTRFGFHPPSGPRTLLWWAERIYTHARDHLAEIRQAVAG